MTLQDAINQYIAWRQAHGAKYQSGSAILQLFLKSVGGAAGCATVTTAQVLAFLAGKGQLTRSRENKYYALAGFYRYAISRGYARYSPLPDNEPRAADTAAAPHILPRRVAPPLRRYRGTAAGARFSWMRTLSARCSSSCTEPDCALGRRGGSPWLTPIFRRRFLPYATLSFSKAASFQSGRNLSMC